MKYKNIKRYFNVVKRALFRSTSKLSYQRTLQAIERLAEVVHNTETDEDVWYMGESSEATLDAVIVGAYWFLADYYGGQNSLEYRVYCRLGEIFRPGCASSPEPESSEKDVYEMLERLYNEVHGKCYKVWVNVEYCNDTQGVYENVSTFPVCLGKFDSAEEADNFIKNISGQDPQSIEKTDA